MCGIIAYSGNKDVVPLLIKGLKRLEYRGYDSAGIAVIKNNSIENIKTSGKVKDLELLIDDSIINGVIGIAHTRWATHGEPNDTNSHPHLDQTGKFALIHNGIIENYSSLKVYLEERGVKFSSETDTEVLVQLISYIYHKEKVSFEDAVRKSLKRVVGAYGIVIICSDEPKQMIAARHGSPLVLGINKGEYFIASDASPIIEHTREVIYFDEAKELKGFVTSGSYSPTLKK